MPSRFFDFDHDIFSSLKSEHKVKNLVKTGFRRAEHKTGSKPNSASQPSFTSPRDPSFSSSDASDNVSSRRPSQRRYYTEGMPAGANHDLKDPDQAKQIELNGEVQEWVHQVHIQQQKQYWWCSSCFPKEPAVQEPASTAHTGVNKFLRRVRIMEPTHAYE